MTNTPLQENTQAEALLSLTEKLQHLEMTQAYQEESIESLEKTIGQQHQDIQLLKDQIRLLSGLLKSMKQDAIKSPQDEAPPPHY
ncbi:MAG: SlyX protein [Thiomicrorhabdus sp.]|nr:MAG: SlyX protein [Thiomicrorhabdus sp.]